MDTKRVVTAFAIGLPALFAILAGGLWLTALVLVVVFYACKGMLESVESSLHLFCKKPTKSKFLGFLGSQKDKIELSGYGNAYDIKNSLSASTNQLVDYMLDSTIYTSTGGILNQHLKLKEEEFQKVLRNKDSNAFV